MNILSNMDKQLEEIGYKRLYEVSTGFAYAKPIGGGYVTKAEAFKLEDGEIKIRFYDPALLGDTGVRVSIKELQLFARKMKEWQKKYGDNQ